MSPRIWEIATLLFNQIDSTSNVLSNSVGISFRKRVISNIISIHCIVRIKNTPLIIEILSEIKVAHLIDLSCILPCNIMQSSIYAVVMHYAACPAVENKNFYLLIAPWTIKYALADTPILVIHGDASGTNMSAAIVAPPTNTPAPNSNQLIPYDSFRSDNVSCSKEVYLPLLIGTLRCCYTGRNKTLGNFNS